MTFTYEAFNEVLTIDTVCVYIPNNCKIATYNGTIEVEESVFLKKSKYLLNNRIVRIRKNKNVDVFSYEEASQKYRQGKFILNSIPLEDKILKLLRNEEALEEIKSSNVNRLAKIEE